MANARDARHSGVQKAHKTSTGDLHSVFADVYGSRWSELYQALARPTEHVALQNAFASEADLANADWKIDIAVGPAKVYRYAHQGQTYSQPTPDPHTRLLSWYWLDRASLLPPLLLNPLPGQTVLDMCSAPGGKSLMLAYMLFAQKGCPATESRAATTATTAASQTATSLTGQAYATSDPDAYADNTSATNCSASSSLPQDTMKHRTADALPPHDNLSTHAAAAAAAASKLHEHEQANASSDEKAQTSAPHSPKSKATCIHIRTDAIDLAEDDTLAELGECVAEAASTPATLSAQHGQNVALSGSLTCNELDAPRRSRLQSVVDAYLPVLLKRKVRVTPHDAARYWNRFEADTYDCILLDAPCTSERHVVQQAGSDAGRGSKSRWSLHQCKTMAALQVKLLTAALKAVKPGGRVMYSTCSLSPMENDEVVSRALANIQGHLQVSTGTAMQYLDHQHAPSAGESVLDSLTGLIQHLGTEATEHGAIILPDQQGAGPMYVCLLVKNA